MITVNGAALDAPAGQALDDFLRAQGYDPACVVVERNGAVVPRGEYTCAAVVDGDILEVLRFVGGG